MASNKRNFLRHEFCAYLRRHKSGRFGSLSRRRYRLGGRLTNPDALRVLLLKNEYGTKNNSTEVNHIYSNETEIATKLGSK
jgi:hypothetical protein